MRAWLLALVFFAAACEAPSASDRDGKIPGELLGTYAVVGTLDKDDCGADLLGAPDPWRFDLKLSLFEHDLYWLNGREAIVGDLDADGSGFHFDTRVDVAITAKSGAKAGCTVSRRDHAEGTLAKSGDRVDGLAGDLRFEYSAKNDSECIEIIGVPGGLEQLPCTLSYAITAKLAASE